MKKRTLRVWLTSHPWHRDDVRGVLLYTILAGALYCYDRPLDDDNTECVRVYAPGAWVSAEWLG